MRTKIVRTVMTFETEAMSEHETYWISVDGESVDFRGGSLKFKSEPKGYEITARWASMEFHYEDGKLVEVKRPDASFAKVMPGPKDFPSAAYEQYLMSTEFPANAKVRRG